MFPNVYASYDVTGKLCPEPYVRDTNAWNEFKNRLTEIEEDDEMAEKININVDGKEYSVNRILKDGKNFVCLADMKQAGFDVGYNEKTNVPSFGVAIEKDVMSVGGVDKEISKILRNNENYIRLRDLEGILNIEYDSQNKKVLIGRK